MTGWEFVRPADERLIAAALDVLGLNYYSPLHVRHCTREHPRETADGHGRRSYRSFVLRLLVCPAGPGPPERTGPDAD